MNLGAPRISIGDAGVAGGVNWRVVEGDKMPGDRRIEWYVNDRWQPVSLDIIFVAIDLICQNEDELYPYPLRGGQMVVSAIGEARLHGFEQAVGWLHLQRMNREQRARRRWAAS